MMKELTELLRAVEEEQKKKKMQANKTTEKAKAYLGQVQREFTEGKKGKLNSKEQIVASFIRTVRILIV